jgi:hypothetical protein
VAGPGRVQLQTPREEPGPQPQQQRGLAGSSCADHDLVGTQPLIRYRRERRRGMANDPDDGTGHDGSATGK